MSKLSCPGRYQPATPGFTQALQQAMVAHQAGDLDAAERQFRRVLNMRAARFAYARLAMQTLCKEAGKWVDGWVVLARRPE